MGTSLDSSLLIYVVVLILVLVIFFKLGRTIWASLLFALVVGLIILIIIHPPSKLNPWTTNSESNSCLYLLILILTPIYVTLFALVIGWRQMRLCCIK